MVLFIGSFFRYRCNQCVAHLDNKYILSINEGCISMIRLHLTNIPIILEIYHETECQGMQIRSQYNWKLLFQSKQVIDIFKLTPQQLEQKVKTMIAFS